MSKQKTYTVSAPDELIGRVGGGAVLVGSRRFVAGEPQSLQLTKEDADALVHAGLSVEEKATRRRKNTSDDPDDGKKE